MREIPYCFDCWPGGPVTPPPCRRCGSTTDYYTSGLCARCHPHAPGRKSSLWKALAPTSLAGKPPAGTPLGAHAGPRVLIDSCPGCGGWGVTRTYGWICSGCRAWKEAHDTIATCATCQHVAIIGDNGSCRLCHKQRSMLAHQAGLRLNQISLADANRSGQQLFMVGMWHDPHGAGKRPYIRKTVPPDMSLLQPVTHQQLVLFDLPRDLRRGLQHGFPAITQPALEKALHAFARDHAARHGWKGSKADRVQRGIRIMLAIQDTPGAAIRRSDVALLSTIKHSAAVVADVLTAAGMLDEDRQPAVVRWFHPTIADLPDPTRHELGVWLEIMLHGSTSPPRRHPRQHGTISTQLRWALPALRVWATRYQSLREVSRDDVRSVLPAAGTPRATMLQGLRSIFRILKGQRLVFVNPTNRLSAPVRHDMSAPAVDLDALRANLHSDKPTAAAITALLAFHGVRLYQIGTLKLTDLHDGRLHLGDHTILLAEPVRQRLNTYLDYRSATWPTSINPHLFIHRRSWTHTRPATPWWIRKQLGMSGQAIRMDRILDEAHTTGGDLRALCDLFGLSISGAQRYALSVNPLNTNTTNPPRHSPTPDST